MKVRSKTPKKPGRYITLSELRKELNKFGAGCKYCGAQLLYIAAAKKAKERK